MAGWASIGVGRLFVLCAWLADSFFQEFYVAIMDRDAEGAGCFFVDQLCDASNSRRGRGVYETAHQDFVCRFFFVLVAKRFELAIE